MTFFKPLPESPNSDRPQPVDVALDGDWHDPASSLAPARRRSEAPSRRIVSCDSPSPVDSAPSTALFLSETIGDLNIGARFLDRLSAAETAELRKQARRMTVPQGTAVFTQGIATRASLSSTAVRSASTTPRRPAGRLHWRTGHRVTSLAAPRSRAAAPICGRGWP
jgi:hypothetical protein